MTIQDLGQKVKDKYQQYVQYPVEELGRKVIEKYPEYKSKLDQSFQVMNDIGERYGQQEKMGYLLTGGSGNVAGKVKEFLQAKNLPGQTMAQAFSDMRTNNPQYQTNVKMSMGAPISETEKQGTRDSALQFAAGTTEPLKMPGFKGLNSAINKASNIEDVLGSKPYVSGIPQRWMYKDSNGVPQDVPDDIVKLIRKTGYKPFKLQKVTKTSNNLYHTTPSTNLDSIAREGLVTGKPARFEGVSSPTKISFSANEAGAAYYGGADDVMIRTKSGYDPGDLDIDLLAGGEGTYRTGKNIPPEMLEVKIKGKWQPLTQASTSQGKASNGLKFDLESTGGEKRLIVDLFPDESIRGKGITKAETLKAFDNAYKQGNKIVEPSNGIWTNDGFGFIKHLEEQGYVKQIPNRGGIERFEIIPRTQATASKKQSK